VLVVDQRVSHCQIFAPFQLHASILFPRLLDSENPSPAVKRFAQDPINF
jgi:hypothetical protein